MMPNATKTRTAPAHVLRPAKTMRVEPDASVLAELKVMRRVAYAAHMSD